MTTRHAPTNRELGAKIGVSPSMASRLRNGKRRPSLATVRRISRELDIPLERLVTAHGNGAKATGKLITQRLNGS